MAITTDDKTTILVYAYDYNAFNVEATHEIIDNGLYQINLYRIKFKVNGLGISCLKAMVPGLPGMEKWSLAIIDEASCMLVPLTELGIPNMVSIPLSFNELPEKIFTLLKAYIKYD